MKGEEEKLNNYIKQFKEAMKRKNNSSNETSKKSNVETEKISAQL